MTKSMRSWIFPLAVLLPLLGLFAGSCGAAYPAPAQDPPAVCSNATLNGSYGWWEQGNWLAPLPVSGAPAPPYPYAAVGTIDYDGNGNVSAHGWLNIGGYPNEMSFTGTYAVNPDCTTARQFTLPSGDVLSYSGTITGAGMQQEVHYTYRQGDAPSSAAVAVGTVKKMPVGRCSLVTLKGAYGLFGQGTITVAPPGFPLPPPIFGSHVGVLIADGKGNMSGSDTENHMGMSEPKAYGVAYTVNSGCVVTSTVNDTAAEFTFNEKGVITGEGESQEVHLIIDGPGWVYADTLKAK